MDPQADFEKKLNEILEKYKSAIESRDSKFLTDYLSHCLDRDVVVSPKRFKQNEPSILQKISTILFKIFLIFLFLGGSFLYLQHNIETKDFDVYAKDANYWLYFFRAWSVRLGLNKLPMIQRLHESECFIQNPYHASSPRECSCGFRLKRYHLNDTANAQRAFLKKLRSGNINPFIIKNALEFPVSYTDLRTMVFDAQEDFDSGNSFVSTLAGSSVSSDYRKLFADEAEPPKKSHISWEMSYVGAAHHMRSLFPRPYFVPPQQEINLSRSVIMFGSQAPKDLLKLSAPGFPGTFYIQAWGRQTYGISSDPSCKCAKNSIVFMLEQGDLIYYHSDVYDLFTKSGKNSTSYSLGYFGSISTDVAKKVV